MKKLSKFFKSLWKDESGQGMTEYILILVVIVSLAIAFGGKIKSAITSKTDKVSNDIQSFE
jgi:Flp pilus assembly pilin Flp